MKLRIEAPSDPVGQALPTVLTLSVENPGDSYLLLDQATVQGANGHLAWLKRPVGVTTYDAGSDTYRHLRDVPSRSIVPAGSNLVRPSGRCEAMLRVCCLDAGTQRISVKVEGWVLPAVAVTERVHATTDPSGAVVRYARVREAADAVKAAGVIVAVRGLERVSSTEEVTLEITPDPASARVLELAGEGARLVARCHRVGGAWVAQASSGALHLLCGEQHTVAPPEVLFPEVFAHLDRAMPFEPLRLVFWSDDARTLRDSESLPLQGLGAGQQLLEASAFFDLLSAVIERGLSLTSGAHSVVAGEGLIVR